MHRGGGGTQVYASTRHAVLALRIRVSCHRKEEGDGCALNRSLDLGLNQGLNFNQPALGKLTKLTCVVSIFVRGNAKGARQGSLVLLTAVAYLFASHRCLPRVLPRAPVQEVGPGGLQGRLELQGAGLPVDLDEVVVRKLASCVHGYGILELVVWELVPSCEHCCGKDAASWKGWGANCLCFSSGCLCARVVLGSWICPAPTCSAPCPLATPSC